MLYYSCDDGVTQHINCGAEAIPECGKKRAKTKTKQKTNKQKDIVRLFKDILIQEINTPKIDQYISTSKTAGYDCNCAGDMIVRMFYDDRHITRLQLAYIHCAY